MTMSDHDITEDENSLHEVEELRLIQLCQALEVPYESIDGHNTRRYTWPELLELVRGRTRAWYTLLARAEFQDPAWLDEWRKQPSNPDPETRWRWDTQRKTYGPPV